MEKCGKRNDGKSFSHTLREQTNMLTVNKNIHTCTHDNGELPTRLISITRVTSTQVGLKETESNKTLTDIGGVFIYFVVHISKHGIGSMPPLGKIELRRSVLVVFQ